MSKAVDPKSFGKVAVLMGGRSDSQDADDYARTAMEFPLGGVVLVPDERPAARAQSL